MPAGTPAICKCAQLKISHSASPAHSIIQTLLAVKTPAETESSARAAAGSSTSADATVAILLSFTFEFLRGVESRALPVAGPPGPRTRRRLRLP